MKKKIKLEAVIFDLSGTIVDFGSLATIEAMKEVFKKRKIIVTNEIIKKNMGIRKISHIKKILDNKKIKIQWRKNFRLNYSKKDLKNISKEFDKCLKIQVKNRLNVIPHAVKIFQMLRKNNIKIGSTTGYPNNLVKIIKPFLFKKKILPQVIVSVDNVKNGRPSPEMCIKNFQNLNIKEPKNCLKVDDSLSGIMEGKNANMITAGMVFTGIQLGYSKNKYYLINKKTKARMRKNIVNDFKKIGTNFIIDDLFHLSKVLKKII